MSKRLGLVLFSLAIAIPALAQSSEEPWGYVYVFRTLRWYPLVDEDNRIGRLPENHVALTSARVSRRHAAIRKSDAGVELLDVGSSNGSRLNGKRLRAHVPVPLHSGDRIQLADELLLFHTSLEELLQEEIRLRLLSSIVKLRVDLPQDTTRRSFGRERTDPAVTDVVLGPEGIEEIQPSKAIEPGTGFATDGAAFVGNVDVEDSVLHVSLWGIAAGGKSMTSRRSSMSRLKHTSLRVALADSVDVPERGPWFPPYLLAGVLEVFPDERELSLRFATSLASQEEPDALRDGAESLAFRHIVTPDDGKLLALAAKTKGRWVDTVVTTKKLALTDKELEELAKELEDARRWLEECKSFGAHGKPADEAEKAIAQAHQRLTALRSR